MSWISKRFSLVELLIVMAITSILLAIVIPSFVRVTKGANVEMGARQIGAQLKAVREYAITNRVFVALIMEPASVSTKVLPSTYQVVSYRPCIVTESTENNEWDFSEWVQGERWEFLPTGARLKSISGFSDSVIDVQGPDGNVNIESVPIFSPTGKCEGVNAGGGTIIVGEGTHDTETSTSNEVSITVAGYTGRISYGDN